MSAANLSRQAVADELRRAICIDSFPDFLTYCTIESDGTPGEEDDPDNTPARGPIGFKPYPYQLEAAERWQGGGNEIILKERQLGFSWLDAAYAVWVSGFHPSSHTALFSKSEREIKKLMRKVRYIHSHLSDALRPSGTVGIEGAAFANDSTINAFPSTDDAGIGDTNALVIFDEYAFHPYGEQNLAAVLPTVAAGGQVIINSTSSPELGPVGPFYERYRDAGGMTLASGRVGPVGPNDFRPVFIGQGLRPGRDVGWYAAQRTKYATEAQFSAFYPEHPSDAFLGREGLVYPMYDPGRHIASPPVPWKHCLRRYASSDYGGGDPTALPVGGVYRRTGEGYSRIHIYDALYRTRGAPSVDELGGFLAAWHAKGAITRMAGDPAPGGAVINESLHAVTGVLVERGNAARGEGLGLVAMYLERGWLTFDASIQGIVESEILTYRWLERTDPNSRERYATGTPVDNHADLLDAVRLLVMAAYADEMSNRPRKAYAGVEW